ncbi:Alpha/Beta hydrolase protein [Xylariaceae sp. FL1019]|nr:Alpha/Beta hydrolase protein [Xylariaceae sp. FL1019]
MLPHPDLSFTLPSLHDETRLDCRVHHPRRPGEKTRGWSGNVAVVAHPYAPLGGCFDDHVVDVVAGTLLGNGFLVATFNFRGAGTSAGRTSWTSKPEQDDYISVAGFLAYYAHYLHAPPGDLDSASSDSTAERRTPTLLFAGYSYGAMIVTRLPPTGLVFSRFETPVIHTAAADIRLRAQHLAEQQSELRALSPKSPRSSLGMRVGGQDGHDRHEREVHGEEKIKREVKDLLQRSKIVLRKKGPSKEKGVEETEHCLERLEGLEFRAAYLLVSPPVGIVSNLATMSFGKPGQGVMGGMFGDFGRDGVEERDEKFVSSDTLCVYGSHDGFISHRKMRNWSKRLAGGEATRWRAVEVAGAGHFWVEAGAMGHLRDSVGTFASEVGGHGEM